MSIPSESEVVSGEVPCEPDQNVRSIILSIISLVNDPNESCPANFEVDDMYRRWSDPNIMANPTYPNQVRQLAIDNNAKALRMGIIALRKLEDYSQKKPIDRLFNDYDKDDDSSHEDVYSYDRDYDESDGDGEEGYDDEDDDKDCESFIDTGDDSDTNDSSS